MSAAAGNWNNSYYLEGQFYLELGFGELTKLQTDERSCLFHSAVHSICLHARW